MSEPSPFSLLMAVYAGDRPEFVRRAFHSSVQEQTRRPTDVVLVQDGPVGAELQCCLTELVRDSPSPTTLMVLEQNLGLASAMDAGLARCRYDIVARMDADDVSAPERFAVTLPVLEAGADLVGTSLWEIGADEAIPLGRRNPPTHPDMIKATARWHDPFNHPSVVYRRSAVRAAGGYEDLPLLEDYWLFARMIMQGARVANIAEPLVLYRVSAGAYERRGGLRLLRAELTLQVAFLRSGFTSRWQFVRNVVLRGGYRLVPPQLRRAVYRRAIAPRGPRLDASVQRPDPQEPRDSPPH